MTGVSCPANLFAGVHVPMARAPHLCRHCGGAMPKPSGETLKETGQAFAVAGAYASHEEWVSAFNKRLDELAASGMLFTSEDVTATVGFYREPGMNRNNAVGALMTAAARHGTIERVGWVASRLPRQHGAAIAQWRGKR